MSRVFLGGPDVRNPGASVIWVTYQFPMGNPSCGESMAWIFNCIFWGPSHPNASRNEYLDMFHVQISE